MPVAFLCPCATVCLEGLVNRKLNLHHGIRVPLNPTSLVVFDLYERGGPGTRTFLLLDVSDDGQFWDEYLLVRGPPGPQIEHHLSDARVQRFARRCVCRDVVTTVRLPKKRIFSVLPVKSLPQQSTANFASISCEYTREMSLFVVLYQFSISLAVCRHLVPIENCSCEH